MSVQLPDVRFLAQARQDCQRLFEFQDWEGYATDRSCPTRAGRCRRARSSAQVAGLARQSHAGYGISVILQSQVRVTWVRFPIYAPEPPDRFGWSFAVQRPPTGMVWVSQWFPNPSKCSRSGPSNRSYRFDNIQRRQKVTSPKGTLRALCAAREFSCYSKQPCFQRTARAQGTNSLTARQNRLLT
jgi:hypothetical protein